MARRTTPENERPVTYGAIGATQAVDLLYYPPTGYKPLVREARLGSGRERFDTAAASLMSWGVQRGSGIEVVDIHEGQGAQYHGIEYGADGAPLTLREAPDEAESVFTEDGTPFISNGMEARLRIPFGPFRVNAPVRVMYVINEPRRVGFAYGTLKGHPESGEEAWIVQLRDDDSVWIEVRAISHPSTWFYRLVAPILAGQQRKFTKRYLRALLPARAA